MSGSSSAIRIRAIGDSSTLDSLGPVSPHDDRKRRALSQATLELDVPSVGLRDRLHDRQPQPAPAVAAVGGAAARGTGEDAGPGGGGGAPAAVPQPQPRPPP